MGHSRWNTDTTANYLHSERLRTTRSVTAYTADVQEGRAARQTHASMNPHGITRESRDSTAHPTSLPVGVMFDVTGSMGAIPRELQRRLANLMRLLTERNYLDHPHVLFGAIGDATCDGGPLQVGQFEAGLEIDQDLEHVWTEGGGGGQQTESYELAHYFFARHTATDAWERRQEKGYLFTMGDEHPYSVVKRREVQTLIGDALQADIPIADIMAEVQQKWHVFHLVIDTRTSSSDPTIRTTWEGLLPEGHVLWLTDPKNVAEIIGLVIGLNEGRIDLAQAEHDLTQLGEDAASIRAVVDALRPLALARGIRLTADVSA